MYICICVFNYESRFNMPAEKVLHLGNGLVYMTMYVSFKICTLDDLKSFYEVKKGVRGAKGTIFGLPTPKAPALNANFPWYMPTYTSEENESE